jgi:hypothetical protein
MSKYTAEQKAAILAEAESHRHLNRSQAAQATLPLKEKQAVMQWLREEKVQADPVDGESETDRAWNGWADQRIAAAIIHERQAVLPIVADILDELLGQERERYKSLLRESTRALELQTARLESALNVVQGLLTIERGGKAAVDLPNPLPMKTVN